MMKKIVLSFLFGCIFTLSSVAQKDYKGKIIDEKTGEVLPFVNIGIVEQGVGTVSDEDGLFHLYFEKNEVEPTATVLFSALGYASLNIPIAEMPLVFNEYPVFTMKPERIALNEVVVSNKNGRFVKDFVGYKNHGERIYGYWKDQIALGGELASRIVVKSGLRRLDRFQFEVYRNPSDSLLLRINVYEDDGTMGLPKTNLNTSGINVLVTVKKNDKIVWVDLKPFDIYVESDFILSLELLKVYGNEELGFILTGAFDKYGSYRKYASQDKWERINDTSMAYFVESELMVSEKQAQRFERRNEKKKKKQKTLSGFVISRGRMLANVNVFNNSTKETGVSDTNGRYVIPAKKGHILTFSKKGLKDFSFKVTDKTTQNAVMKSK